MATALILAGNSFIGGHLGARLRRTGLHVAATSRRPRPGLLSCDLTCYPQVDRVLAATLPQWVIQCAGATTSQTRADMDRLHLGGTRNLLQAVARHVPEATVLLIGSAAEYGNVGQAGLPIGENCPTAPESAFGHSKLAQLRLAEHTAAERNLRVLVVRPFNVLGPGLPEHYLAGALARKLRQAKDTNLTGDFPVTNGEATRDWVDVRDVADALTGLLALDNASPGCVDVYNVASGLETSVLALAEHLCRLTRNFTAVAGGAEPSRSDIVRSCGDSSRLRAVTGWRPRITWQQSLAEMWQALPARWSASVPGLVPSQPARTARKKLNLTPSLAG